MFVEVPEADVDAHPDGARGRIRVQVLNDREFQGNVAGTSWSLEPGQRTLRTEIDFDNPEGLLRPGMYIHAMIEAQRPNAWTLPSAAIVVRDGQTFCYRLDGAKPCGRHCASAPARGPPSKCSKNSAGRRNRVRKLVGKT